MTKAKLPRCRTRQCSRIARIEDLCPRHAMREADKLARTVVLERDEVCRVVDSTHLGSLQWAHVHSRSYKAIRHDPRNAVVLCAGHHAYYTHHPLEWEQWCRDNDIAWDELRLEAIERGPSFSLPDVLATLRNGAA